MWKLTQLIWPFFIHSPMVTNTCLSPRLETNPSLWILTLSSIIIQEKHRNTVRNVNLFVVDADSNLFFFPGSHIPLWNRTIPFWKVLDISVSDLSYGSRPPTPPHVTTYTYPDNLNLEQFLTLRFSLCFLIELPQVYTIKGISQPFCLFSVDTQYLPILFRFRY